MEYFAPTFYSLCKTAVQQLPNRMMRTTLKTTRLGRTLLSFYFSKPRVQTRRYLRNDPTQTIPTETRKYNCCFSFLQESYEPERIRRTSDVQMRAVSIVFMIFRCLECCDKLARVMSAAVRRGITNSRRRTLVDVARGSMIHCIFFGHC